MSTPSAPPAGPFPPQTIDAFLRCCEGEWMALRSRFALEQPDDAAPGEDGEQDGDAWHRSERGELVVTYEASADAPGILRVAAKGAPPQALHFSGNGRLAVGSQEGCWQLWPDGSLELSFSAAGATVKERIWFTKPNLRLRSSVASRADGSPAQASFSSEIRRVSRPAEPPH